MSTTSLLRQERVAVDAAPPTLQFRPERPGDAALVDALVARAFGPGRYAKTAERIRERAVFHPELSVCAWRGEALLGAVRLWPARIESAPVLFLGPIAVEKAFRGEGLGAELVEQACRRARTSGERAVILVGDLGFFGPLGFKRVPPGQVALPGPVDLARVLWTALAPGVLEELSGLLKGQPPA